MHGTMNIKKYKPAITLVVPGIEIWLPIPISDNISLSLRALNKKCTILCKVMEQSFFNS